MQNRSLAWWLAALLTASTIACRTTPTPASDAQAVPQTATHASQHAAAHAEQHTAPHAAPPPGVNRDPHADPDVQKYIARLESSERVADLQVDVVLEKLALPADAVIGDLGCGPGIFALAFAKTCPRGVVYASDIEPAQLDRVRAGIAQTGVANIVPVLASFDDPHFPPARLDVVFIGDTFHHLQDRVAYMQRLQRVLKPGGRLVVLEYKPGTLPVGPPPEHKLEAGVLVRELTAAGYAEVQSFSTHPYHDFIVWRVLRPHERAPER